MKYVITMQHVLILLVLCCLLLIIVVGVNAKMIDLFNKHHFIQFKSIRREKKFDDEKFQPFDEYIIGYGIIIDIV